MKVKFLGHATFAITSDTGVKIITDPYETGPGFTYGDINESADIVTVSHDHHDHGNVAAVNGNPEVVRKAGRSTARGIEFRGIASSHDDAGGSMRGGNVIFCFELDGVKVCHLGDLGHLLDDKQLKEMGSVDILLIPVGGYFTIDAKVATRVCDQIKPKVIIPMHYKTEKSTSLPIFPLDEFIEGKGNVTRQDSSGVEFKAGELPAATQIVVLEPAL